MGDEWKLLQEIFTKMDLHGRECGEKIAQIARKLHPDALAIFPSYRSAFVIPPQGRGGRIVIFMYGDPHANGAVELTEENVRRMKVTIELSGGRYIPNVYVDGKRMIAEKVAKLLYGDDSEE
ncbi:MAG: hypothetical protein ACXQS5_05595 [Candidatus Methanospirareceae archaeon]